MWSQGHYVTGRLPYIKACKQKERKKERYICHLPQCMSKKFCCVQKGHNVSSFSVQTLKMNRGAKTEVLYIFKSVLRLAVLHTTTLEK